MTSATLEITTIRQSLSLPIDLAALAGSIPGYAHDYDIMAHHMHMAATDNDARHPVSFPPKMRQHILANMPDHLQAVADILTVMSGGDYANASQIANARLGLDSTAAEGCKAGGASANAPQISQPANTEQIMARFMP